MKCEIDTLTTYYHRYCAADASAPITYADTPTPLPRRGLARVRSILSRWASELSSDRCWPHLPPAERLLRAYHLTFTIPRPLLLHYFPDHHHICEAEVRNTKYEVRPTTINDELRMTNYENALTPTEYNDLLDVIDPDRTSYLIPRT